LVGARCDEEVRFTLPVCLFVLLIFLSVSFPIFHPIVLWNFYD
jgi:hypothetical protein